MIGGLPPTAVEELGRALYPGPYFSTVALAPPNPSSKKEKTFDHRDPH